MSARPHFLRRYGAPAEPLRFGGAEADSMEPVAHDARLWQRSGFRCVDTAEPTSDDELEELIEAARRETLWMWALWAFVVVLSIAASAAWPWGFAK